MSFRKKSAGYLATLCYTLLFVVSSLRNTIRSLFTFIFFKHEHCVDFLLHSILVVPKKLKFVLTCLFCSFVLEELKPSFTFPL